MKNIIYIISFLFISNTEAQELVNINLWNQLPNDTGKYYADLDNYFDNFVGTWEYQNGNQTFQISLWKETKSPYYDVENPKFYADRILGHFKMILNKDMPNESIIYHSDKNIGNSNNEWPPVIMGMTTNGVVFSGQIFDNAGVFNSEYPLGVRGDMMLTITANSLPPTATFLVTLPQGMYAIGQPKTFTIPTNITLTKVN